MYQRILVPVDGSQTSRRGLDEAIKLSKALGASIRLVHIIDDTPLALNPEAGVAAAPLVADFAEAGKQIMEEARAFAAAEGVQVDTALYENFTGRVAERILEDARKCGASSSSWARTDAGASGMRCSGAMPKRSCAARTSPCCWCANRGVSSFEL
jgi:nucleotide-binding universal stress UspA family protein